MDYMLFLDGKAVGVLTADHKLAKLFEMKFKLLDPDLYQALLFKPSLDGGGALEIAASCS